MAEIVLGLPPNRIGLPTKLMLAAPERQERGVEDETFRTEDRRDPSAGSRSPVDP